MDTSSSGSFLSKFGQKFKTKDEMNQQCEIPLQQNPPKIRSSDDSSSLNWQIKEETVNRREIAQQ